MANYPRELFESEQVAKEQIPLLFGDLKTVSASSVGSDKVEAAPTRSNRTEVTHSTNVSDQSQVRYIILWKMEHNIFIEHKNLFPKLS